MKHKLCIDCKYIVLAKGKATQFAKCGYNRPTSLVDGAPAPEEELSYCSNERKNRDGCNTAALHFAAKESANV
jgi:hypothetical protein